MAARASRSYDDLKAAKAAASQQFLAPAPKARAFAAYAVATHPDANVVGVGIGQKVSEGKATGERCVRFYVARKLPKSALQKSALLPAKLDGVATDVIETGIFTAQGPGIAKARSRLRPVQPGCSVGFKFPAPHDNVVMAGTLGAIVEKDGVLYILSNNHVLADENQLKIGAAIFQPGLLDGGKVSTDRVAKLAQFRKLKKTGNAIDAAIAKLTRSKLVSSKFVNGVSLSSTTPIAAAEKMAVHKVGRTTGYTQGIIEDISADVKVGYEKGDLTFVDQILIRGLKGIAFSNAGDSGSLIVDRKSGAATGLLFAGSTSYTIANHIELVLNAFGVELSI